MGGILKKRGPKMGSYGLERKISKKGDNKDRKGWSGAKNKIDREVRKLIDDIIYRVEEKDLETQEFY